MSTHSPGAVRAGKRIADFVMLGDNMADVFAEMIDAETACKELAEACRGLLVCMDLAGWADDFEAVKARQAIAKWEGRA